MTSVNEVKQLPVEVGLVVNSRWEMVRKIGEGACGVVWEAIDLKTKKGHAAVKFEPRKEDQEMLKMEAVIMRSLSKSTHAAKLFDSGCTPKYNFIVMKMLGPSLCYLREQTPQMKFTLRTAVRIAMQTIEALRDLHEAGFVHRDVKPANFVMGAGKNSRSTVFMLDFGLSRIVKLKNDKGEATLRPPRGYVRFRGTPRYCSVLVHRNEEPGLSDDIWSIFYMFIEMFTGDLPWRGLSRIMVENKKVNLGKDVMIGCPKDTVVIYKHLRKLNYFKVPDYKLIVDTFSGMVTKKGGSLSGPLDWEPAGAHYRHVKMKSRHIAAVYKDVNEQEADEKMVLDVLTNPETLREVKDIETEFKNEDDIGASVVAGHSNEDSTLLDVDGPQSK
ncbi:hypothetical protein QR680_004930 [Steinernema hermaphroditum]|uniref:non-specific serine/threonine protein kinase n=1 Tax=Steinernema hermaphroditum TaxID=289476 RepID=A0AA39HQB0_9BILA|nr:hypothetical protein QR680_004930 [Steinernema hermaphroditum]